MSGLDDKQWFAVELRLKVIDTIAEEVKNIQKTINQLQVEVAETNIALFGKSKQNGMNAQVKRNTADIDKLKDDIPEKPKESNSKKARSWIPVIVCVLLFIGTIYTWIESSITKTIKQQTTISAPAQPTP